MVTIIWSPSNFSASITRNTPYIVDSFQPVRIAATTLEATGQKIPSHVLRQTSAVMHTRGQDTSLLRELGWAGNSASES